MAVSKRLRHEVMRRDDFQCRYCGATAPDVKLTIDHVTPVSLGGQDVPQNLVTACVDCNAGKSATPPDAALVAAVDEKAVEWAQAMQVAVERRTAELASERATTEPFDREWLRWTVGDQPVPRDANWRGSITRLLAAGLTNDMFANAVEKTMGQTRVPASDKWKYFCGICWREVDKLHQMARGVASPGSPLRRHRVEEVDDDGLSADDIRMIDDHNRQLMAQVATSDALQIIVDRLVHLLSPNDAELQVAVSRVVFDSCAAAERIYSYGVSTQEKVDAATAQLTAYVKEAFAREQVSRPHEFDYMHMFDSFADDLTRALGGNDEVVKFVNYTLWSVMPEAHGEWKRLLHAPEDDFDAGEDDLQGYAINRARDHFESSCAPGMYHVGQWWKTQHAKRSELATQDGPRS